MKFIEKFEKFVACACVSVMAVLVFANVIARFIFNSPLAVADEMSCYLFVLMSFMGTAIAARKKAHLGLTIVTDKLSPSVAKKVQVLMYIIAAIFCLLIIIFGVEMVMSQYSLGQETATMQWPEWIYGLFVPIGAAFAMIAVFKCSSRNSKNKGGIKKKWLVLVLLGVFVLLLAFGAPIAVCLGMSSVAAILVQGAGKPLVAVMSVLPRICSASSSKFVLLAIPFFIISGNVMEKAGISGRLINLAEKCLGHIKGGMAIVCVVVSCFFAAISGSGPATVAALGLIMIPALVKAGYPAAFSCALMAAGGAIGVVIPPSITFVVYGSIADASITDLF